MSRGPGRIVETLDVTDPRPRTVETRSPQVSAARAQILEPLLSSDH
jgi:NitT/TauT family transport system ATP-binding protein